MFPQIIFDKIFFPSPLRPARLLDNLIFDLFCFVYHNTCFLIIPIVIIWLFSPFYTYINRTGMLWNGQFKKKWVVVDLPDSCIQNMSRPTTAYKTPPSIMGPWLSSTSKLRLPNSRNNKNMASRKQKSPTRFMIKALLAALELFRSVYQNPMSR